jgi:hypothetical protein
MSAAFCPSCGTPRQPDMQYCAKCAYDFASTPQEVAGTPSSGSRIPLTLAAGALIGIGVLAIAAVAILSVIGGPASPTDPYPGERFHGDGYSILVPTEPTFSYSRDAGGDIWLSPEGTEPYLALYFATIPNLFAFEESLEGVLGRARSGVENTGATISGDTAVSLPAGPAYRIDASLGGGPVIAFVFYNGGVGYHLQTIGMDQEQATDIASTVVFGE